MPLSLNITDDEDLQANLTKYLLKTLCSELFNTTLTSLATEHMISVPDGALESVEVSGALPFYRLHI